MRSRAVRAALALAALALIGGCSDLVSSLTPFGLGERKPDQSELVYTGAWTGTTDSGGQVTFTVIGGEVDPPFVQHVTGTCTWDLTSSESTTSPIEGDSFSFDLPLEPQGRLLVSGRFTSPSSASGIYSFEGKETSAGCPTSGSGSFTATKDGAP